MRPTAGAVALLIITLLAACSSVNSTRASGAQSPSPQTSASSADSTANWVTYTSSKWGYSLRYPQGWLDLPNFGATDTEKYFSNENVSSPAALDNAGLFVSISVNSETGSQCLLHGLKNSVIERQGTVAVDGVSAPLNVLAASGYPELILDLEHGTSCYWFVFVFRTSAMRDATQETAELMLGHTFRFG